MKGVVAVQDGRAFVPDSLQSELTWEVMQGLLACSFSQSANAPSGDPVNPILENHVVRETPRYLLCLGG